MDKETVAYIIVEEYLATKKKILPLATTWIDLRVSC